MRYVDSMYKKSTEERAYRIYVTDTLRALIGGEDLPRYEEIINADKKKTTGETGDEIKNRIKNGLNSLGRRE